MQLVCALRVSVCVCKHPCDYTCFVSFPALNPGAGKLKLAFMPERNTFSVRRVGDGSTTPTRPHVQSSTTISSNKTMHSYRLPVNSYPEISPPQFTGLNHCGGLRKCSHCGLLEAINLRECLQLTRESLYTTAVTGGEMKPSCEETNI